MSSVMYPGRNLVLIGMMGTGKSAVAKRVAQRLGRAHVDTDTLVAEDAGKPVQRIFAEDGARWFRELEAVAVRYVTSLRGEVVSVGGGAVLDPGNVTALRMTGDLVWLDATPEVIAKRVGDGSDRPLLADADDILERIREIYEQRRHVYERASLVRIDTTDRRIDDVVADVLAWAVRQPGLLARDERELVT